MKDKEFQTFLVDLCSLFENKTFSNIQRAELKIKFEKLEDIWKNGI